MKPQEANYGGSARLARGASAIAPPPKQERKRSMKLKQETKTKQEQAEKPALTLTERQVEDFTKLAQLQKDGAANIKDRR